MLQFKLAIKNLLAAGLRTWLSVIILAFAYILIIFFNGLMDGWNKQARTDSIAWEFGHGQLRHADYDPYDPFTIQDAHDPVPAEASNAVPVLIRQANIYPQGRMQSVLLKSIPIDQALLEMPTAHLESTQDGTIPVIMGKRMAQAANLDEGDRVLMRWRDKHGTFDALEIEIAHVFETNVPAVDQGTIWISTAGMNKLTGFENEATYLVLPENHDSPTISGWEFVSLDTLMVNIDEMIATKKVSSSIIYILLLGLALLAIFDTQVLSIFRRQKEIGTYIALGMTRWDVVKLFTIEGSSNSLLGAALGAVIGTPIFIYLATHGIQLYDASQNMGITIAETMFPVFGVGLILTTLVLIFLASTLVSFWPARKIANMDPTLALKGKVQ